MTAISPVEAATGGGAAGLAALFDPRGIAVVGASANPDKVGAALCRSLRGYAGALAPVNPRADGMFRSVVDAAAAAPVDLALIAIPAAQCPAALADAAAAGARAAVICGGGFAEVGPAGAALQAEIAAIVARTGIRVLGPNTSGFVVPRSALTASFVPGMGAVPAGRVAVVAASGGVNHAVAFALADAGHGVSLAVGLGNAVDVTAPDVLAHLVGDDATTAVALHVESVADGPRLVAAVRELSASRPVVALVVGRHDVAAFAASHTGALATSWRTTRAALAQAGAVLVDDLRELVDAVGALSVTRLRPAAAPGVGVLTAQAGPGLLLLDDLRGRGAPVPELRAATRDSLAELLPPLTYQANPVDTGRPGPGFGRVLAALAADPGVDLVAGYALDEPDAFDLADAVRGGRCEAPVVFGVGGFGPATDATRRALLAGGVAVAGDPRGVGAATAALLADSRARHRAAQPSVGHPRRSLELSDAPYDEAAAKDLLEALGVATMARRACRSREDAHRALVDLGAPVAVKLLDAAVLHKSEVDGVHLGVRTPGELDAALDLLERGGATRFLVESMAPAGVDLIVGARRDPVFGPLVLLGLGGTTAEALADVAVRLAPLTAADAAEMPGQLAGAALLAGWRGGPVLDVAALAEVLVSLGSLLAAHPALGEIEINPLRLCPAGLVALDAVVTREASGGRADR